MSRIKVKVDKLEEIQRQRGWTDTELASRLNITRTQLWRVKQPDGDPNHVDPGQKFISNVLRLFPDKPFEYFFEIDVGDEEVKRRERA
ncbi:hypothetical protein [Alicyclobacillus vulcanalis]|uniref:HTH cro/C1-type domain-containing protein n=1 Tax=Alicyclobacillus vulcanalis TaxID=252246 RepID=A0A1N7MSC0_9BACL|nr:hypothetical protein [Alicyclobacillus vulcanalis]SIS89034.1 hypothetical protein SAMN05421799_10675 [Alicyclobacillus vulcanalis]